MSCWSEVEEVKLLLSTPDWTKRESQNYRSSQSCRRERNELLGHESRNRLSLAAASVITPSTPTQPFSFHLYTSLSWRGFPFHLRRTIEMPTQFHKWAKKVNSVCLCMCVYEVIHLKEVWFIRGRGGGMQCWVLEVWWCLRTEQPFDWRDSGLPFYSLEFWVELECPKFQFLFSPWRCSDVHSNST